MAVVAGIVTSCGRVTRSASEPSGGDGAAAGSREERSAEHAGTHTGNTGQGRSHDASSRPISGMSGSPTGSPMSSDSAAEKK